MLLWKYTCSFAARLLHSYFTKLLHDTAKSELLSQYSRLSKILSQYTSPKSHFNETNTPTEWFIGNTFYLFFNFRGSTQGLAHTSKHCH
jgi:hypothetical protein